MTKPETYITFRVTKEEKQLVKDYCDRAGRTYTDVLRELVRSLKPLLKELNSKTEQ